MSTDTSMVKAKEQATVGARVRQAMKACGSRDKRHRFNQCLLTLVSLGIIFGS